ncbi:hypothetical protein A4A49_30902 [Nicotiana attenuata]|uniref:Carboxypeptidase A inhibitor-like domain-containing protein n=1 Tax=Nicotiana attenuata TaxID=49451 RepID=A0A1J6KM50_NICAT|nr:hypothetical protein A4A49_30902 [Nicotiana attenuata]
MEPTIKPLRTQFLLLLLLLLLSSSGFTLGDPIRKPLSSRRNPNRVPECGNIGSKSDCLQKQDCRWCKSDVLDDACFSKSEAPRLPSQIFPCHVVRLR